MIRRKLSFVVVPMVLLAGACSKETTTTSPTTAVGAATTTAAVASGQATTTTVAAGTATPLPSVTKPATITKVDKTKLPAKAQAAKLGAAVTDEEQDCINQIVLGVVTDRPEIANDDAMLAGLIGKSITLCVSPDKIAALLTDDLKGKATDDQIACVKGDIMAAAPDDLATFLGAVAISEMTIIKSVSVAMDAKCGTNLAAGM